MPTNQLRELRLHRGMTMAQMAELAGIGLGQYIKLERGERALSAKYLTLLARAHGTTINHLLFKEQQVPIIGLMRDDGLIVLYGETTAPEFAPVPPLATPDTIAIQAEGSGMWSNAFFYVTEPPKPFSPRMLTKLCAFWVKGRRDGPFCVGRAYPTAKRNRFDVVSPAMILTHNVHITDAARIRYIAPND